MHLRRLAAITWTALILVGTLLPASWLSGLEEPDGPDLSIPHVDKLAHLVLFGGFGFLWTAVAPRGRTARVIVGGVALAILTELGQGLPLIGRHTDVNDLVADTIGVFLGIGIFRLVEVVVRGWMPVPGNAEAG